MSGHGEGGHAHAPKGHSHGGDLEAPLLKAEGGHGGHGSHDGCCGGHEHGGHGGHENGGHEHGDHEGHEHGGHGGHAHDDHGHSHGGHAHGHGAEKEPPNADDQQRLKKAVMCALFFMMVEIVGGCMANSLAIITDAAHMLSDVGGFIVSLVALQLSAMEATHEYTYGFKQAEVLGALLSVAIVWGLTAVLLWEAIPRFVEPEAIEGKTMFIISVIGFVVNLVLMQVLGHGHSHGGDDHGHSHGTEEEDSVAVQAALAHVIGDIVQSLGVCLASLCIWLQPFDIGVTETSNGPVSNWNYADPMCTCLFGVIVLNTTKSTIVRTISTLMGKAPKSVDQIKLIGDLENITCVVSVHDFHVWSLGSKDVLCTAHLVVKQSDDSSKALSEAVQIVRQAGVFHSTFQVEVEGHMLESNCGGCDSSPVDSGKNQSHGHSDSHGHSH
eukprot:TRINITY_DN72541_c0_g1_i1.p1 TRINITY_DN72541_c0_g1~~TRINITY_DN72541_c0_g1_i1.p1  ORF type:complete len:448 (-),score=85.55 TRINITY_DN72541_c0_g1_i1:113-1432(-)